MNHGCIQLDLEEDDFKIDKIPDELIIEMFDSLEGKLQLYWSIEHFIMIRRVLDNKIMKL